MASRRLGDNNTTQVLTGKDIVIEAEVRFFSKTKKRIDTYMNYTRPPLAIGLDTIRKAFLDAKSRRVRLRYLTEITQENLQYCKELLSIVDELRHLDGIKGNFMISEGEYLAPLILFEKGKIAPQIIYSNVREIVEQQQYIFDNLWNNAISAKERIKEIEEGVKVRYETKVLKNQDEIVSRIKEFLVNSNELLVCSRYGGLQLGQIRFSDLGKQLVDKHRKGEHKGIRLVTTIDDKGGVELIKILLKDGLQIKDIKNIPPMNFSISDKEMHATIEMMEGGRMIQTVLVSNEPIYINHFRSIFEDLWTAGMDARVKIRNIEEGVELAKIEIIQNPIEAIERFNSLIKLASHEVLRIFPSIKDFRLRVQSGIFQLVSEALDRGVDIRILIPAGQDELKQIVNELNLSALPHKIHIRSIDKSLQTTIGILVVDRTKSLIIESMDDTKDDYLQSVGLAAYSNSRPIATSYASIFESLWKHTELYEQLQVYNIMQEEFINIAAHELRTPIQQHGYHVMS